MGANCAVSNIDVIHRSKTTIQSSSSSASTLTVKQAEVFNERYEHKGSSSKVSRLLYVRERSTNAEYVCRKIERWFAPCRDGNAVNTHLRNLNSLDHPHLCKFVEAFEDTEFWYLIYEKADAMTLFRHIQAGESFCEEDAAEYTRQIAQSLAVSHEQDIVHGRLSPSKILIAPMDQDPREGNSDDEDEPPAQVKICDHGQGVILREGAIDQLQRAKSGNSLEPRRDLVECMAPEVAWDEVDKIDRSKAHKMDIWSLGCIVYHMLTGVQPHRAASMEALMDRVKSHSVEFREDWDILSQDARQLTERMLMVNPGLRPSAATLLRHPWLRLRRESLPKARMLRLMRNIRSNVSEGHFKRMVLRIISQQMSSESHELTRIERAFRFFDKNGDGVLGLDEILAGVRKMDVFEEQEINDIDKELKYLDRDGSQTVNLQEFTAGSLDAKRAFTPENLWHAFNAFDVDKNGKVSIEEVEDIVRKVEAGLLGTEQVDGLVQKVRKELQPIASQGNIDFNQFVYIATAPTGAPHVGLAIKRDVYTAAYSCIGMDLYKVRQIQPKPWKWQQASRSSGSAYRRASLVVPGRRHSTTGATGGSFASFDESMTKDASPADKRSTRGQQPTQASEKRRKSSA